MVFVNSHEFYNVLSLSEERTINMAPLSSLPLSCRHEYMLDKVGNNRKAWFLPYNSGALLVQAHTDKYCLVINVMFSRPHLVMRTFGNLAATLGVFLFLLLLLAYFSLPHRNGLNS